MFLNLNNSSESLDDGSLDALDSRLTNLRNQILHVQSERKLQLLEHRRIMNKELEKLKELNRQYNKQSTAFLRDQSIRYYSPYMKSNNVPSCVHLLQSRQLRSLHQMCVLDYQKSLVEKHANNMIAETRRAIARLVDEKALVDVQMLNTMVRVQTEGQEMHQSYESVLSEQNAQLEFFQDVVHGIEMEQSMAGGLASLVENASMECNTYTTAKLKDGGTSSCSSSLPARLSPSWQYSPKGPSSGRRTAAVAAAAGRHYKKLTLGEMLQKGCDEKQDSSFNTSVTEGCCSDDGSSVASFLSQSFSNTATISMWREKRALKQEPV